MAFPTTMDLYSGNVLFFADFIDSESALSDGVAGLEELTLSRDIAIVI